MRDCRPEIVPTLTGPRVISSFYCLGSYVEAKPWGTVADALRIPNALEYELLRNLILQDGKPVSHHILLQSPSMETRTGSWHR